VLSTVTAADVAFHQPIPSRIIRDEYYQGSVLFDVKHGETICHSCRSFADRRPSQSDRLITLLLFICLHTYLWERIQGWN